MYIWDTLYFIVKLQCIWDTLYCLDNSMYIWDTLYFVVKLQCIWDTLYCVDNLQFISDTPYCVGNLQFISDTLYCVGNFQYIWDTLYCFDNLQNIWDCIVLTIFSIFGTPVFVFSIFGTPCNVLTLSNLISPVNVVCIWQVVKCLLLISLSFLANFSIQSGQTSLISATTNLIPPPPPPHPGVVSYFRYRLIQSGFNHILSDDSGPKRNCNRAINIFLIHHPIRDENSEISTIKK